MLRERRRYFIYGGMFMVLAISYIDRINISVAAPFIATEYGLDPIQMGYLFSSYLWTYLIFLIPFGIAVDRWGARRLNAGSLFVWSIGGVLTGLVSGFGSLLGARMLLGIGEAAGYPAGGRIIREWAPVSERGRAAAWLNGGAYAGLAVGAIIVGWIVTEIGWRESFFITGGAGIVLAAVWYLLYRKPEHAPWISNGERRLLADEALADRVESTTDVVGPKAALAILLKSKTMWGLMLAQGCAGYTLYLFMTWLPSYLVSARGLDVLKSSLFTAIPFGAAVVLGILLGRVSDSYLHRTGVAAGGRRKIIAICMLASSVILLTPVMPETWEILVLFSISATAIATAMAMNIALTNDLLVNGALAGTAVSFLIFGGNSFGLFAPIITGYIIAVTASYTSAFLLAGALLLAGAVIVLTLTRHPIGAAATPVNHKPALL